MTVKNKKFLFIFGGLLLTVAVFVVVFWQSLIVYLAPKLVLAGALKDRIAGLEARIAASPVPVLARGIDAEGCNQLDLQLDTANELLGTVQYDLRVQIQQHPKRLLADGQVSFKNEKMDLSLYLDDAFAAVSSREILGGKYYGLTYESFSKDIRANKLTAFLIGEKVLTDWETAVRGLQDVMQREAPVLPDLSRIDPEPLVMGILAMEADVERIKVDLNGREERCHVISFEVSGGEIASGLQYLNLELPNMPAEDAQIKCSFWLKEQQLCKMGLTGESCDLDIYWGDTAISFLAEDDIYIEYYNGNSFQTCKIHTEQMDNLYRETIVYTGEENIKISYDWVASTGSLTAAVDTNGGKSNIYLNLKPTENGFWLETQDFGALMHLLTGVPDSGNNPCVMTVTKGSDFETPDYKNFTDWSMDDLLTLLSGFGSLLGLNME